MLAAEHYVAIIQPLHYINWTRSRYIVIRLLIAWLLPVVLIAISNINSTIPTEVIKVDVTDTFHIPFVLM